MSAPPQPLSASQAQTINQAMGLLRAGEPGQALTLAREVARLAPRAPDAQQVLAMCHADAGNVDEADQAFRRALQLAPGHPLILINHAAMLRRVGRPEAALPVLQDAVEAAPESVDAWRNLGSVALELGRFAQARTAIERALRLQPRDPIAWHVLGSACRAVDDLDAAEAAFRHSLALRPGNGAAWINLAAVLRLLGRPGEALACLDAAAAAGYQGPELADARAGALLDIGQLADALQQARHVTRSHPQFVPGHVTLAQLLWEYGPLLAPGEEPLAAFRRAAQASPTDRPLQLAWVRLLMETDQPEEALSRIRALRAAEDRPELAALQADALEQLDRSAEAARLYQQAHPALAASPEFLNAHARHLLKTGHPDVAVHHLLAATRLDPSNQAAWALLGTAWRLLGDAREFWLCDYERLIALVEVEPPPGHAGVDDFLTALQAALDPLHQALRAPLNQSLRSGSQTPGRLFGRAQPLIAETCVALQRAAERHLAGLPSDPTHPFLGRIARSLRFSGSWSVKLWSSGRHVNHMHPQGWMSSAFYVALPPSVQSQQHGNAGHIQFGQPPVELGLDLSPRRIIRPRPGWLALFPSYMWHGTLPFEDAAPRVTIAFDMLPAA
jgi:Flp pilus assembly protein TadD